MGGSRGHHVRVDRPVAGLLQGVARHLPNAQATFDPFHVMAQASPALDLTRRAEEKRDPALKGMRWTLLKDSRHLNATARDDLDALMADVTTQRMPRAWRCREPLREILNRKQINVVRILLRQWCTNVARSKVEPMKAGARLIRALRVGIVAWAESWATHGLLESLNRLFQAPKRKAQGYWPVLDSLHRDRPDRGETRRLHDPSA